MAFERITVMLDALTVSAILGFYWTLHSKAIDSNGKAASLFFTLVDTAQIIIINGIFLFILAMLLSRSVTKASILEVMGVFVLTQGIHYLTNVKKHRLTRSLHLKVSFSVLLVISVSFIIRKLVYTYY